jgi:hypothetical protein
MFQQSPTFGSINYILYIISYNLPIHSVVRDILCFRVVSALGYLKRSIPHRRIYSRSI